MVRRKVSIFILVTLVCLLLVVFGIFLLHQQKVIITTKEAIDCDVHYVFFQPTSFWGNIVCLFFPYYCSSFYYSHHFRSDFSFPHLCSLESANRSNPELNFCIHVPSETQLSLDFFGSFGPLKNIEIVPFDIKEIFQTSFLNYFYQSRSYKHGYDQNIDLSDLLRLAIIEKYNGGMYVDLDCVFLRDISDVLDSHDPKLDVLFESDDHTLFNGAFYFANISDSEFFSEIIDIFSEIEKHEKTTKGHYKTDDFGRFGMNIYKIVSERFQIHSLSPDELKESKKIKVISWHKGVSISQNQARYEGLYYKKIGDQERDRKVSEIRDLGIIFHIWKTGYDKFWQHGINGVVRGGLLDEIMKFACPVTREMYLVPLFGTR